MADTQPGTNGMILSKPIVVLVRPREPFEIAALILCLLSVAFQAIDGPAPNTASAAMPLVIQIIWLALVGVGSAMALTGVFLFHRALNGMVMEAIGLSAVASGLALNGIGAVALATLGHINTRAAVVGPLSLTWALCSWIRFRRVHGEIKALERECKLRKAVKP